MSGSLCMPQQCGDVYAREEEKLFEAVNVIEMCGATFLLSCWLCVPRQATNTLHSNIIHSRLPCPV